MTWKESLERIIGVAKVARPVAKLFVRVPMLDAILTAIVTVEALGGTGPEKMEAAIRLLQIGKPFIIDMLEQQFSVDIPDEAADAYIKGQVQLVVDLLNSLKMLPKKTV